MRKIIAIIIVTFFIASCSKEFDRAMKSTDKDVILKAANNYFEKKKWKQAISLYEKLPSLVAGTDDAANVGFNSAYANYYDKNYRLAAHQFKNFAINNPRDPRREEAFYLSALSYSQDSRQYNLDQESTVAAISELQDFLNNYPDSDRSKNISQIVDELSFKLEYKAYENARQYYKMAEYKAADIAFENVLEDYPATKLKPKIINYMMQSKEQLAIKSSYDLKAERLDNAIAFTRQVERDFPNTDNSKDAVAIRQDLEKEKVAFAQVQKEREARILEHQRKLSLLSEADAAKIKEKEANKKKAKAAKQYINKVDGLKRDSAILSTPAPKATFRIPRG